MKDNVKIFGVEPKTAIIVGSLLLLGIVAFSIGLISQNK